MPRTTSSSGRALNAGAAPAPPRLRRRQTGSTAKGDRRVPPSLPFRLLCDCTHCLFGLSDVFQRELAGLDEVRHERLRTAAEQREEFVDQPALRDFARQRRLEDMRVAD